MSTPIAHDDIAGTTSELRQIPIDRIDVPPRPPRRFMGDIAALAESMQDYGLQQPIAVRADPNRSRFILTSGLRRLTAARALNWTTIPAFIRTVDADHAYLLDLIENLQRQDLSPEEEADALGELIRTRGWTMQQVADGIKRSMAYVSKRVRVFEDAVLRQAIVERGLPVSTAEELLAAEQADRPALVELAVAERWDQPRARYALRAMEEARQNQSEGLTDTDSQAAIEAELVAKVMHETPPTARPRGLTRAIREFHDLLSALHAADLTNSDRAALRSLFRDLTLLARAPTTRQAPVFPPLPAVNARPQLQRRARSARARS
jgi:ParB family chromosome partitioning protein